MALAQLIRRNQCRGSGSSAAMAWRSAAWRNDGGGVFKLRRRINGGERRGNGGMAA